MKRYVQYKDDMALEIITLPDNHKPPINNLGEAPSGEEAAWLSYSNSTISIDAIKKAQILADRTSYHNNYATKRIREYPSVGNQLDAIYKKLQLNDSTDWDIIAAQIAAVKIKYPKPE